MNFNIMLQLEQFRDPAFRQLVREVFPHYAKIYDSYPDDREGAKVWEITNTIRAFREFGVLRPDSEVLGVAAGFEHTVYWLTNHVRRVFCTDLYDPETMWKEANGNMLTHPERFAYEGLDWNPRRLVVQYMNALDLKYEEDSFDAIFSSGSIEHFGSLENVAIAMSEIGRVLKPGGIAAIATEFRISGPKGLGVPGAILFTPEMLRRHVVASSGLELVDKPDWSTSQETIDCVYPLAEAIANGIRQRSIAVSHDDYAWTSGMIVLRKPV